MAHCVSNSKLTKRLVSVFLAAGVVFLGGCFDKESDKKQDNVKSDEQQSSVEQDGNENQNNVRKNEQWIVGTWINQEDKSDVWVFNADRTGSFKYEEYPAKISTYAIADNKIAMVFSYYSYINKKNTYVLDYSLSSDGKFLILGGILGYGTLLRKKDGN